jgi:tetratricopeptide (TPR) repeat protein
VTMLLRPARLAGVALAMVILLVGFRLTAGNPAPSTPRAEAALNGGHVLDGNGTLGLKPPAERVAFWEARVEHGGSYLDLIHLADAYLDRSRATGDLGDLERADLALDRAGEDAPYPEQVDVRRALVAFALHDFQRAMRIADELLAAHPTDLAALGVAGDARLETGDLDGARLNYQRLAQLAPSPGAWSRLARISFLTGDIAAAERLVARAAASAEEEGAPDAVAFYRFQLGELRRASGDVPGAARAYKQSLTALPDYVPATAGLARVREAQGRRAEAIRLLEAATVRLPQPELVAALGDLYELAGGHRAAERQWALVERIAQVAAAGGSVYDRQLVLFAADHDRGIQAAVRRARAELEVRGDIYGHDALAWVLFKAGEVEEAASEAAIALSLATPDPRLAYHAGMIAAARGDLAAAQDLLAQAVEGAVYLPPLQARVATDALASVNGGRIP